MARVVRAGDEGWSVIAHSAAEERAQTIEGSAVPVDDILVLDCIVSLHLWSILQ